MSAVDTVCNSEAVKTATVLVLQRQASLQCCLQLQGVSGCAGCLGCVLWNS